MPAASRTPIAEIAANPRILKTTTSASGSTYVVVGHANTDDGTVSDAHRKCRVIFVMNDTGVALEFGYAAAIGDSAPTGETISVPTGCQWPFYGLTDHRQLLVRRTDVSNTTKTFKAIAYN